MLVTAWSQLMSIPQQKSFATTTAFLAAFPILAGHVAAGFSEHARVNLSVYGAVLAGAQKNRGRILSSQSTEQVTPTLANMLLSLVVHTGVLMGMALQTSATLNQTALDGYVDAVRQATASFAAMARASGASTPG
jgi:hypothetical protein